MAKKPKRPRAPKRSSSYQTWQAYEQRVNAWAAKCSQIIADKKKKAALIQKLQTRRFAF